MGQISKAFLKKINDALATKPLKEGECRRIDGAGSHFVSLAPKCDGRSHFFASKIETGVVIYVFKELK